MFHVIVEFYILNWKWKSIWKWMTMPSANRKLLLLFISTLSNVEKFNSLLRDKPYCCQYICVYKRQCVRLNCQSEKKKIMQIILYACVEHSQTHRFYCYCCCKCTYSSWWQWTSRCFDRVDLLHRHTTYDYVYLLFFFFVCIYFHVESLEWVNITHSYNKL